MSTHGAARSFIEAIDVVVASAKALLMRTTCIPPFFLPILLPRGAVCAMALPLRPTATGARQPNILL